MTCGDDSARVQQRTTTEVGTVALQTDDVGKLASCSGGSTDDIDRVLGGGGSGDCGGHETSEECLELHLGELLESEGSECWKRISEWMMPVERRTLAYLYFLLQASSADVVFSNLPLWPPDTLRLPS